MQLTPILVNMLLIFQMTQCETATVVVTTVLEKHDLYIKSTNLCSLCCLFRVKHGFVLGTYDKSADELQPKHVA